MCQKERVSCGLGDKDDDNDGYTRQDVPKGTC